MQLMFVQESTSISITEYLDKISIAQNNPKDILDIVILREISKIGGWAVLEIKQ